MIKDDVFICDHCGKDSGEFDEETGNHPTCNEVTKLQSENRFLTGVIEGMKNTDNEKIEAASKLVEVWRNRNVDGWHIYRTCAAELLVALAGGIGELEK